MSVDSLRAALRRLDGGSYGALKSLVGSYAGRGHRLVIDRVQPDPYAPPSRIRVLVPLATTELPADLLGTVEYRRAVRLLCGLRTGER
ncbi:ABC-ATPase domain-containing protein [Rothia sp. 11254D007CT]